MMTYERREQIFSKDYITTHEIQELLGFKTLGEASSMMTKIRWKVGDRLGIRGRIHTEDYFEYFGITPTDRYNKPTEDTDLTLPQDCKAPLSIQERHNQIFRERGIIKDDEKESEPTPYERLQALRNTLEQQGRKF